MLTDSTATDRVLSSAKISKSLMTTALKDAYLKQFADDAAIDIYVAVWERVCERVGLEAARKMMRDIMAKLPSRQRTDVDCNGNAL